MNVIIKSRFVKEEEKLKNPLVSRQIAEVILAVRAAETLHNIPSLKRLKGAVAYRIRISDYRIGVLIEDDNVEFIPISV